MGTETGVDRSKSVMSYLMEDLVKLGNPYVQVRMNAPELVMRMQRHPAAARVHGFDVCGGGCPEGNQGLVQNMGAPPGGMWYHGAFQTS